MSALPLGMRARTLRRKWTRQRCQAEPRRTFVRVADHELYAAQTPGPERAQEGRPEGTVLTVADREPEDLPVTRGGHPGRDDDRLAHDRGAVMGLDVRRVEEHVREADMGQGAAGEGGHHRVELGADPADLALADPGVDAQGAHEIVDLAGGHAVDVGLHDDRPEGTIDPTAWLRLPLRWVVRSSVRS